MAGKDKKPEIRFAGFTDDWEQRKLGEYAEFYNGDRGVNYPQASDMVQEGIPFINAGDLIDGHVFLQGANKITQQKFEQLSGAKIKRGDILYCLRGTLGKNAFVDNFDIGTVASSLIDIRPKNIDGKYLFYILNSDIEYRQRCLSDEGAAQPNLSAKNLSGFDIPIPTFSEQVKVGEYLENLNNLINLHQFKYDKLVNIKKSMLEKMFPKNGAKVPEIRFAGFTDAWEQCDLSQIVDIRSGRDYKHLLEGNIPVYGTGGYMLSVNDALSYDVDAVGIGRKGTIDKPYILKAPFWTVDTLFYAVPKENNDLDFIYDVFQTINWRQKDESTGVPSLSKTTINGTQVSIPKDNEQVLIGNFFRNLDNLITLQKHKLDKLKNIKKSCLEKMFIKL